MALSYSDARTKQLHTTPEASQVPIQRIAPPGLLQCLMLSWSDRRVRLIREAAESESWEAIVCADPMQFVRTLFQQSMPLALVDLPPAHLDAYQDFRNIAERVRDISKSLMIVSVAEGNATDEVWARQLGVWSYLPEMSQQKGWEVVFQDARQAVARQASVYLESNTQIKQMNGI